MKIIKTAKYIEAKKKSKKKGIDYKGKHYDINPFAVCYTTVNKKEEPEKYEKCVKDVKNKSKKKKD